MMDNDFETENVSETHNEDHDDEHHLDDFRSDSDENEFIDGTISSQITHEDFEEGQEFEHSKKHSKSYDIESRWGKHELTELLKNKEFKDQYDRYLKSKQEILSFELILSESELMIDEQRAYKCAKSNFEINYLSLVQLGKKIRHAEKTAEAEQALDNMIKKHRILQDLLSTPTSKATQLSSASSSSAISAPVMRVEQLRDKPQILTELKYESLIRFKAQVEIASSQISDLHHMVYISSIAQDGITNALYFGDKISRPSRIEWEHWPSDRLFSALLPLLIQGRQDKTVTERIQEQFETKKLHIDFNSVVCSMHPLLTSVMTTLRNEQIIQANDLDTEADFPDKKNRKLLLEVLVAQLKANTTPVESRQYVATALDQIKTSSDWHNVPSFSKFLNMLQNKLQELQPFVAFVKAHKPIANLHHNGHTAIKTNSNGAARRTNDSTTTSTSASHRKQSDSDVTHAQCQGCGKPHPNLDNCHFKTHPDFNNSSAKWVESYNGKFWKSKGHSHLVKYLKRDGDQLVPYGTTTSSTSG